MFRLTALVVLVCFHFGNLNGLALGDSFGTKGGHRISSSPSHSRFDVGHNTYKEQVSYVPTAPKVYESETFVPHQKKEVYQTSYLTNVDQTPVVHHKQEYQTAYKPKMELITRFVKPKTQLIQTVYKPKMELVTVQKKVSQAVYRPTLQTINEAPLTHNVREEYISEAPKQVKMVEVIERPQTVYRPSVQTTWESNVNDAPLTHNLREEYISERPKQVKMVEVVERPQTVYRPSVQTNWGSNVNDAPLTHSVREEYQYEAPKQVKMVEVIEKPQTQQVFTRRVEVPVIRKVEQIESAVEEFPERQYTIRSRPAISSAVSVSDDDDDDDDDSTSYGHNSWTGTQSGVSAENGPGGYHYKIGSKGYEQTSVQVNHGIPSYTTSVHRSGTKY